MCSIVMKINGNAREILMLKQIGFIFLLNFFLHLVFLFWELCSLDMFHVIYQKRKEKKKQPKDWREKKKKKDYYRMEPWIVHAKKERYSQKKSQHTW